MLNILLEGSMSSHLHTCQVHARCSDCCSSLGATLNKNHRYLCRPGLAGDLTQMTQQWGLFNIWRRGRWESHSVFWKMWPWQIGFLVAFEVWWPVFNAILHISRVYTLIIQYTKGRPRDPSPYPNSCWGIGVSNVWSISVCHCSRVFYVLWGS